ncbi:cation transporter [Roseomonas mucosa]|uniref:cation transporter n=1 Tax=Roseomonas mucosa TaxID=207340 RepID=UPI002248003D|nr:cation transporter [Roseomonas mucosa]UZO94618.1 Cobalt-zinc-cadmium resistance protein czcD [Roseomonas mucosa]
MDTEREGEEPEVPLDARDAGERRILAWVLGINLAQALAVGAVGLAADSTGLMGAALDNLADAGVYAVGLYAVGRTAVAKARVARLSGTLLIVLGLGLLVEVLRRFFAGADPVGLAMIVTAIANAAVNVVCLRLLRSRREQGVHLKASWIFTTNDMLANAGIVLSGAAVMLLGSPLPDLLIGLVVVGIVLHGGWEILEQAREARRAADAA